MIRNRIYVTHGADFTGALTATVFIYDRGTNTWSTGASAGVARSLLVGVCVEGAAGQGLVFTVGGTSAGGPSGAVEIYDPAANSWAAGAPLPTPRSGLGAALVPGFGIAGGTRGTVYAIGGIAGGPPLGVNEAYDVELNVWVPVAPMPFPMTDISATIFSPDTGLVYVIGGSNGPGLVQIYDPQADLWAAGTPMPTARSRSIAGICGVSIYVIGGTAGGGLTVNEAYDPITDSWTPQPAKPTGAWGMASQTVSSGMEIYAIGGNTFPPSGVNEVFTCGAAMLCTSDLSCRTADSCGSDTCDLATGTCVHTAVAPAPVGETMTATHDRPTGVTRLSWTAIPCPTAIYNTYRGTIPINYLGSRGAAPYDHACFESADAAANGATLSTDPAAPPVRTAFYYVASSENLVTETILGTRTGGTPIPNNNPCPTPP